MTQDYSITPQGDDALVVRFGHAIAPETHRRVMALLNYFTEHTHPGVTECVPAYTTLTIFYDPCRFKFDQNNNRPNLSAVGERPRANPYEALRDAVQNIIAKEVLESVNNGPSPNRVIEIPVYYGGSDGPDLNDVAAHCGLTPDEVIEIHSAPEYLVYLIGFVPGFPYLGGMSPRIAAARRATPRAKIPPGSIGIGGTQTGIYPIETPGGWQLIGRTPIRLFDPDLDPPSLLRAGDRLRFRRAARDESERQKENR